MDVNELTIDVLNAIKTAFKNKTINITISEAFDETEYLLASKANAEHLEKSMKQAAEGKVVAFTLEEFQNQYGK
jgi:predicted P-loop ATPase/GTPase